MNKTATPTNPETPMTSDDARRLAATMRARGDGLELFACVDRAERGDRITFVGGRHGAHSLSVDVTSEQRARVHWRGYCENNGIMPPPVKANAPASSQIVPEAACDSVRRRLRADCALASYSASLPRGA